MSIDTDIACLRSMCSEAWAVGERMNAHLKARDDPGSYVVKVRNDQLRRVLDELDRLRAPKNRRLSQDGFLDTEGEGL